MKIQEILLSVVAITAIGVTATAESRPYTFSFLVTPKFSWLDGPNPGVPGIF